ncbi:hypothetical protein [Devosia sediminis]|uniref:Uncharacterized protein n=1 Tax=Devosia sediminis TaxID=2798801 RepID=A0A934IYX2_9HYPH|nr:hypothetical protein [Devosia sediminis]MBJ3785278.1 hypothetical protein [Devosia sediminis]
MRVPNAGQDLMERRIVREGKAIAARMLADYVDPPDYSVMGLARQVGLWVEQLRGYARSL